ncbi:MAG: hypothetical protein JRN06_01440 [Nitrososphaerota archaeon]|nr:hypothetical protein [Nitrososphaerota archaeon]MDG7023484.1 hypothetical protein [Nitrososphaerota archaeon]
MKDYVEIASVPNPAFFARLLQSLGVTPAHVAHEGGEPLKTRTSRKQASTPPVFDEFIDSYRYQKMTDQNESLLVPLPISSAHAEREKSR